MYEIRRNAIIMIDSTSLFVRLYGINSSFIFLSNHVRALEFKYYLMSWYTKTIAECHLNVVKNMNSSPRNADNRNRF